MKRAVIAAICAGMLLAGCSNQAAGDLENKSKTQTNAAKPVYVMAGRVEAGTESDISSKITGRVTEVAVDIGSNVKRGDVLLRFDAKELEAQLAQARAGVSVAQANLDKARSGGRPEQKSQAKASLDSELKSLETAKKNYERMSSLFQDGAVSKSQLETAEVQLAAAQARYTSAQEQLNMLSGESNETIEVMRAQLEQAQAAYDAAQARSAESALTAPVDGVVSAMDVNVGETVSPGKKLVAIVNSEYLAISAYLPSSFSERIKPGQEVAIKVSEVPGKLFAGTVTAIDPAIDENGGRILVKVIFIDRDTKIKPGMFAQIGLKE